MGRPAEWKGDRQTKDARRRQNFGMKKKVSLETSWSHRQRLRNAGHQEEHIKKFSIYHSISRINIAEPVLERFAFWVLKEV